MKLNGIHLAQFLVLVAVGAGVAHATEHSCSNATLHGNYTFTITGQILTPAPAAGVVSGVALTTFNGDGTLTQVDHVLHQGVAPIEEWRPGNGSYQLNPDCTGWMTIVPSPTIPADNSPSLKLEIVVAKDGSEIHTVVTSSPSLPPFTAAITSIGVRVNKKPTDLL